MEWNPESSKEFRMEANQIESRAQKWNQQSLNELKNYKRRRIINLLTALYQANDYQIANWFALLTDWHWIIKMETAVGQLIIPSGIWKNDETEEETATRFPNTNRTPNAQQQLDNNSIANETKWRRLQTSFTSMWSPLTCNSNWRGNNKCSCSVTQPQPTEHRVNIRWRWEHRPLRWNEQFLTKRKGNFQEATLTVDGRVAMAVAHRQLRAQRRCWRLWPPPTFKLPAHSPY